MPNRTTSSSLDYISLGMPAPEQRQAINSSRNLHVNFIGNSRAMREISSTVELVAVSDAGVLITGESGTGKDVVARLIHLKSPRADLPFIALNCAAVPREILENELFGHETGAFSSAPARKSGYLEMANHGTLFLDELTEMDNETQAKLLRVIETKSFRRLGGKEEISVDVRILASTSLRVTEALQSGELRRDLSYRFSAIEITLPPLRERIEEIPLLVDYFLLLFTRKYKRPPKSFSAPAMKALMNYAWPGNIRELKNVVERAVLQCTDGIVGIEHLPMEISKANSPGPHITIPMGTALSLAEKEIILQTLHSVENNKSKAAGILGLSRKALYNKLHKFGNGITEVPDSSSLLPVSLLQRNKGTITS
ncbi:MAG: sigma-54-dependent Fis family transcriptional regulator [Ignavibacteriae bacterium]|nr:MAG: sigma-54-dependent Fis family transcriptional regulator [Ignavibacteriota bacterium]